MKKILLCTVAALLVLSLVACGEDPAPLDDDKVLINFTTYEALPYAGSTARYSAGEELEKKEWVQREGKPTKREGVLFGKTYGVHYSGTEIDHTYPNEIDSYSSVAGGKHTHIRWDAMTQKILRYSTAPVNNREYISDVNPNSSEKEYIAYAKKIIAECAGISLDGWEVRITTYRDEYGIYNGFLNYSHEIPEYNAQYTFVFYKTISGIERNDSVYVTMTNVGEIMEFSAVQYEDAFRPFEDAIINRGGAESALRKAFSLDFGGRGTVDYIEKLYLVAKDDALWVKGVIIYKTGQGPARAGVSYVVKVAELVKAADEQS